ncbi:MAG: DUF2207 domain-containing protein [Methanobacterium sp.]|nr:DUF2207 domain-containing protein [Methanobacterium sp.]MDY9923211.1 DUF2207 domain-containing protein [Methanobacterium sp.]
MYNPVIYYVSGTLMLLLSFIPVYIYLKHGREPKIDYDAPYERELPFDDPPAIVNAICNNSLEKVGEPDINGYTATIMDLIDKKYLVTANSQFNGKSNSMLVSIDYDKDFDDLWDFELEILNFLSEYDANGLIDMRDLSVNFLKNEFQDFSQNWEDRYSSREEMVKDFIKKTAKQRGYSERNDKLVFQKFYKNWKENLKDSLWNDGNMNEFFSRKGDKYSKIFGITGTICSILLLIFIFDYISMPYVFYIFFLYIFAAFFMYILSLKSNYTKIASFILLVSYLLFVFQYVWPFFYNQNFDFSVNFFSCSLIPLGLSLVLSLVVPQKVFDQWTPYGKEYYERWMAFKRYISEFSLIEEYPPDSVELWNKYLVYATALGSADGVRKSMEISLPVGELEGNDIYGFQKYDTLDYVLKDGILTAFERD